MQKRLPKPFTLLLFFFFLSNYLWATNQCGVTVWLEDFTGLANGTTSDAGATAWTSSTSSTNGTYAVNNNEFKVSYSGQNVSTWASQVIDISYRTNVSFSIDLRSETASSNDAFENADYIRVYYKLNGGAEVLAYEDLAGIGSTTNTTGSLTFNSASLSGSTIQIIIRASNSDPTERYYFDNIKVTGSNAVIPAVSGTVTCSATAQLSATASSSVSAWSWTGPNGFTCTAQNPVVSAGGQYTVTATFPSGCTVSSSITVAENKTAPDITATGGILGCHSSITLSANSSVSGATYSWTGPNGFTSTSKNPTVSAIGNYTATVTNPANGCTATKQVTVTGGTTATLYNEDLTLPDGTTSDAGATPWSVSVNPSTTLFSVLNNEFRVSNSGTTGEGVWTSGAIDITGKTNVSISANVRSSVSPGAEMDTDAVYGDWIRFYYKLNNGAEVLFAEKLAGINGHSTTPATVAVAGLSGTSLKIVVRARATGNDEFYYFDNVQASATTPPVVNTLATATNFLSCTTTTVGLTGSSTTSGVTYKWTGPNNYTSTAQNPSVTAAGIYTLTITDPSTSCTGSDTALVSLNNTAPGASTCVSGPLTCSNSSVTLSGNSCTSGVTYKWAGPNNYTTTTQNPVVTTAGTYNLTVTNPVNGCTSSENATVTYNNTVTSTAWQEDFTLPNGATADAGATPWSVSVNPSSTLFSVLNNEFRVSNSGTTGEGVWTSGAIDITGKTNVSISANVRSSVSPGAEMDTDSVYGDYIRFYYKLNNGAEVLFAEKIAGINNHSTTPATVAVAGLSGTNLRIVVRVRATGNDEFYYFDNVQVATIANATANGTGGAINCTINSVTLQGVASASGASYSWSGPNGYTSSVQNPVVTNPGIYTLTALMGTCSASDTAIVSRDTSRPTGVTASHAGKVTCNTPTATITGTSSATGLTYSWVGPFGYSANTLTASVPKGGTYTLTATNPANGCQTSANTIVEENSAAPNGLSINNTSNITCLQRTVSVSGRSSTANATYKWSGPNGYSATTATISVGHGGDYTFKVTDTINGCSSSLTTTVVDNSTPPVVTIGNTSPLSCSNPVVTLSVATNLQNPDILWLGPEGWYSTDASATTNLPGDFSVLVTNLTTGCSTTEVTTVTGDLSECGRKNTGAGNTATATARSTPAGEAVANFTWKAYPNPVTSNGVIEFVSPQNTTITVGIYNTLGVCEKVLFKGNATAQQHYKLAVPATQLPAGAYYYIINTDGKTYTGKLIIVK